MPVVPTFELIATVASGSAGPDGDYSTEIALDVLRPWVEQAGAAGLYVVLDLQPGRSDFLSQAKQYEPLLAPAARRPGAGPGVAARPDAEAAAADRQRRHRRGQRRPRLAGRPHRGERLPQKLVVLHQFSLSMIKDERLLDTSRDERRCSSTWTARARRR